MSGRGIGEHIFRFGKKGKYSKLQVKDYAVVDFRVSPDGEPTKVQRNDKKISVFFKEGEFSQCKCIFGLDPSTELLHLNR